MFFSKKKTKKNIYLFNTKGRSKQLFEPIKEGHVKMYSCGPTVYDHPQIGNYRSYVLSDTIRRAFEYAGYQVKQVINVTDFGHLVGDADDTEDKMLLALRREKKALTMENMLALATKYLDIFSKSLDALNIKAPHVLPRASEHVPGMIAYVETLLHKGYAYTTSDGVYFDTSKFEAYGELGGSVSEEHSRTGVSSEKKNPADFALWKFNEKLGWDAPWGKGFPGWHIECTAMSTEYLGKTFDIHTGGIDHIAIHHNNEIAQAESANGKPPARFWLHNEFITISGKRIGKSEGNAITLAELTERGIDPLAYRYWLLTGHYRQNVNFTWKAVEAAQTAWRRARKSVNALEGEGKIDEKYKNKFEEVIFDDFNTPEAIAVLWELLKDTEISDSSKRATALSFDVVLGIGLGEEGEEVSSEVHISDLTEELKTLVEKREKARKEKDFAEADKLRDALLEAGYTVEDGANGPMLQKVAK